MNKVYKGMALVSRLILLVAACSVVGWWAVPLIIMSMYGRYLQFTDPKLHEQLQELEDAGQQLRKELTK